MGGENGNEFSSPKFSSVDFTFVTLHYKVDATCENESCKGEMKGTHRFHNLYQCTQAHRYKCTYSTSYCKFHHSGTDYFGTH